MAALKLLLLVVFIVCDGVEMKAKEQFSARVVEDLVQQEIARKMPAAATRSTKRGKSLTGVHLKAATDAINKLVDESIVDRVQEAEKEVSQMLLKSIEHHIQDAGKVLLNKQESDNTCRDKLESCEKLKEDEVCESSKDAMVVNCPSTCNFCGMLEDLKKQSEKELEEKPTKQQHKKLKSKKLVKVKKGHKVKHHKQANLAPEELRLIHQNMLDQAIDHANLPMAVSSMAEPVNTEEDKAEQEAQEDEVEKLAAVEHAKEVEEQHKEAERTQRKKKKLALKKAKEAKQAKAEALEAGREAAAAKLEAKKAKAEAKHKAAVNPVPMASSVSSSQGNDDIPPSLGELDTSSLAVEIPGGDSNTEPQFVASTNTHQNDLTAQTTDVLNRKKQTDSNSIKKDGVVNKKKKTDVKLKHEIENMVDKAFGELLL